MFKYWLHRVEIIIFMFVKLQWNILGRTSVEYGCFSEAKTFLRSRSKRITEFLLCFPRGSRVEIDSLVLPVFLWCPRAAKMPASSSSQDIFHGVELFYPKGHIDNSQRETEFFLLLSCIPNARLSFLSLETSRTHTDPSCGHAWVSLAGVYSFLLPWCSHATSSLENCTCYLGNSNSTVGTQ